MEEPLQSFLQEAGKQTVEQFGASYPHAFLFREVFVTEGAKRLNPQEIEDRTRRFHRLIGRHGGYVLGQTGSKNMEELLREVVVSGATKLEPRIVRLRRPTAAPGTTGVVHVGAGEGSDVKLQGKGVAAVSFSVEPSEDRKDHWIVGKGGDAVYDGERLVEGKRVVLEEGLALQLGVELTYQTFSAVGLMRYLTFRVRLEKASAGTS